MTTKWLVLALACHRCVKALLQTLTRLISKILNHHGFPWRFVDNVKCQCTDTFIEETINAALSTVILSLWVLNNYCSTAGYYSFLILFKVMFVGSRVLSRVFLNNNELHIFRRKVI